MITIDPAKDTAHAFKSNYALRLRRRLISCQTVQFLLDNFYWKANIDICWIPDTNGSFGQGLLSPKSGYKIGRILPLCSPSPPPFPPFFPLPLPFLALPVEVGPLNPARGSTERCKLPSGVWGGAPFGGTNINDFPENRLGAFWRWRNGWNAAGGTDWTGNLRLIICWILNAVRHVMSRQVPRSTVKTNGYHCAA